jgi:6-pyruvoyltetrahydropterin/6-carboxytetrahydropterin synthase
MTARIHAEVHLAFKVRLEKESFKFSSTHFTILGPDQAERLHGHNYYVWVELEVAKLHPDLGFAFDFNLVKPQVQKLCGILDEYVLLPVRSPYLKVTKNNGQIEVMFHDHKFTFPVTDVRELPIVNVTCEELARYLTAELAATLPKNLGIIGLTVSVNETRGQGVSFTLKL